MKTLKYLFITLGLIVFSMTGCDDDDFLKEDPKAAYTLQNAFDKSSQVEAQLLMAYYEMYGYYGNDGFLTKFMYQSFGTDALDWPYWHDQTPYSQFSARWTTSSNWVSDLWNSFYRVVSYANLTLYGADLESIEWTSEDLKNRVKAEARFFRGLAYLRLGELYGGVPYVDTFSEELKFDYTRESREQTYQRAIDDLKAAYDNLPDYPIEDGRVAKGAAATMLAEAYLAKGVETGNANGEYAEAIDYATVTINLHPLMTERFGVRADASDESLNRGEPTYKPDGNVYADLFYPGNFDRTDGNTEAVWVMQTGTYEQQDVTGGQNPNNVWMFSNVTRDVNWAEEYVEEGAASGPWKRISPPYNTTAYPAYLGSFGISQAAPPLYASYDLWNDPTDLRYEENVTVRTAFEVTDNQHSMFGELVTRDMLDQNPANLSKFSPLFAKIVPLDEWPFRETDSRMRSISTDTYAIRSAQAYLLRAEAYLRSGENQLAAADVNTLRERAQCTNMFSAGDMDIDVILDARLRELLYEEGRWFTLLRMKPEEWRPRIYNYSMAFADYDGYSLPIEFELWPIPQTVIELNTEAEFPQNEGWD